MRELRIGLHKRSKIYALSYLEDAIEDGAEIAYETRAERVTIENGKVKGIRAVSRQGAREILADIIVLAAGGVGTPVILQNSGIKDAGAGFFADLLVNVYGVTNNDRLNQVFEPVMALVNLDFHRDRGFLLSPYVNHPKLTKFIEFGVRGLTIPDKRTMGIMVKITDEPAGQVYPDGTRYPSRSQVKTGRG